MPAAPKPQPVDPNSVEGSGEAFSTGDLQQQTAERMGEPESESVVVVFGRFNPPTIGHEKLLKSAKSESERTKSDFRVYPSRTQDAKKNPLQPGTKIEYMQKMFPDYADNIKVDANAKTIIDVLLASRS